MLKNYMEIFVENLLPNLLTDCKDICTCPRCIEDIKALALNSLKPLYVVTEKGSIYVKLNELESQFRADVIKELLRAVEVVSKNTHHE